MAKRVVKGSRIAGIDADSWNEFVDTAAAVKRLAPAITRPRPQSSLATAITVEARNDSGGDWEAAFPIVRFTTPPITPADRASVIYQGVQLEADDPDSTNAHWGVMQGPARSGEQRQVVVSGLTWCKVDVTDEDHTAAAPVSGDADKLESGDAGAAIVYKPSGTGELDCIVLLGVGGVSAAPALGRWGVCVEGIPAAYVVPFGDLPAAIQASIDAAYDGYDTGEAGEDVEIFMAPEGAVQRVSVFEVEGLDETTSGFVYDGNYLVIVPQFTEAPPESGTYVPTVETWTNIAPTAIQAGHILQAKEMADAPNPVVDMEGCT